MVRLQALRAGTSRRLPAGCEFAVVDRSIVPAAPTKVAPDRTAVRPPDGRPLLSRPPRVTELTPSVRPEQQHSMRGRRGVDKGGKIHAIFRTSDWNRLFPENQNR